MKRSYFLFLTCLFAFCSLTSFSQIDENEAIMRLTNIVKPNNPSFAQSLTISGEHVSNVSGIHHFYLQQHFDGIPIYGAVASVHFSPTGDLIQSHEQLIGVHEEIVNTKLPEITAIEAIRAAALELGFPVTGEIRQLKETNEVDQKQVFENESLNQNEIRARLMYQFTEQRSLRLCWNFDLMDPEGSDWWDLRVDAQTGEILSRNNLTVNCGFESHHHDCKGHEDANYFQPRMAPTTSSASEAALGGYRVYAMPIESPADGNRTLEVNPYDVTVSPNGWHDTTSAGGSNFTYTFGNNVHAYEDGDNPGYSPDGGGGLNFDFVIDTVYSAGSQSEDAVITNLFYWNNIIHDMMYHYGFDEVAGNFQQVNYGNGGIGEDYVNAEAQDNSGSCNANFGTPSDGSNPRMQMYTCGNRDGDLDNVVIVHEYAHGISNRLTGGPTLSGCLNNQEQMGEGWSDYLGLIMTIKAGDDGDDPVPVGNWLFEYPINGPGIRPYPYSTDLAVNPQTYDDIKTAAVPHGLGSVWCTMLWEMTWALIDEHGFDADLIQGTGGNNMALQLVMEGMKLQPCSPGFVDGRDAILLADQMLYGGANQCLIWEAFAKRGLGANADQGSSSSRSDGTQDFRMPTGLRFTKTVDKAVAMPGDTLTYTLTAENPTFCDTAYTFSNLTISDPIPQGAIYIPGSASNGGSLTGDTVSFPTVVTLGADDMITRSFSVYIDPTFDNDGILQDDVESGPDLWDTTSTVSGENWYITNTNSHSGDNSWFAENFSHTVNQYLEFSADIDVDSSIMSFWHSYQTEANWDGGVVQYSTDGGNNWLDLGPFMTLNGYNGTIDNNASTPAFSGYSGGYIQTKVNLSPLAGQTIRIRFWMSCDYIISSYGWHIDDIVLPGGNLVFNTATYALDGEEDANMSAQTEVLSCLAILEKHGIILPGTYQAADILKSEGIIENPSHVTFKAEDAIELEPNFEVELGAELNTIMDGCIEALTIIRNNKSAEKIDNLKELDIQTEKE